MINLIIHITIPMARGCNPCSIFIALVFGLVFLTAFQSTPVTIIVAVFFLSYAALGICYHMCNSCANPQQPQPVANRQPLLFNYNPNQHQFRDPPVAAAPHMPIAPHPAYSANNFNHSQQLPEENQPAYRETFHQEECTVCFDQFAPTDVIARLNCGHKFHQNCIIDWLDRQLNCPNCRKPLE